MATLIDRTHPRTPFDAPIQWAVSNEIDSTNYHEARMLNYSPSGLCYETDQNPDRNDEVTIIMKNYTPDQSGPECYHSYQARICWCLPLATKSHDRFMVGAQIIGRSYENLFTCTSESMLICDLCDALMPMSRMNTIDENVQLCDGCYRHLQSFPRCSARRCLERFMMGNVV